MAILDRQIDTRETQSSVSLPSNERVAVLEERSRHTATAAQLYKVALGLLIGIVGTLGGLIIHLHNLQMALIENLLGG